jgi:hypothetical protein
VRRDLFLSLLKRLLTRKTEQIRIIDKSGPLANFADRDHTIQYMVAVPRTSFSPSIYPILSLFAPSTVCSLPILKLLLLFFADFLSSCSHLRSLDDGGLLGRCCR